MASMLKKATVFVAVLTLVIHVLGPVTVFAVDGEQNVNNENVNNSNTNNDNTNNENTNNENTNNDNTNNSNTNDSQNPDNTPESVAPTLTVVGLCSDKPSTFRTWKVTNNSNSPVDFTWEIDGTSQTGSGTVAANDTYIFDSVTEGGNSVTIRIGGDVVATSEADGSTCEQNPKECGSELVSNGSFETPIITKAQGWDAFPSGANGIGWKASWINSAPQPGKPVVANLELQNGHTPQDGSQYTELDSDWDGISSVNLDDASVSISQFLPTNSGSKYNISYYTSPAPGTDATQNKVQFSWDGSVIDTTSEDGTSNADTVWTHHTFNIAATSGVTELKFADAGVSNTFGSWLDNVSVTEDCRSGGDGPTVVGLVYDDANENSTQDGSEGPIEGRTVKLISVSDDPQSDTLTETEVGSDVTDVDGNYSFADVADGCYIVREVPGSFEITEPNTNAAHEYYINVGGANCDFLPHPSKDVSFLESLFFNEAQAASDSTVFVAYSGQSLKFGNFEQNNGGGSSSGSRTGGSNSNSNSNTPPGRVLGDSTNTPSGQVLGDSTTLPRTGLPFSSVVLLALAFIAPFFIFRDKFVKNR